MASKVMAAKSAKSFVSQVMNQVVTPLAPPDMGTTYYCLVVDNSGSMKHLKDDVPKMFVNKITNLAEEAKKHNQKVLGTVVLFDWNSRFLSVNQELSNINNEKHLGYTASGSSTALFDAVEAAILQLSKTALKVNDAVLVEIITDGEDNASKKHSSDYMKIFKEKQNTGQWTFVFQLPIGGKHKFVRDFGIPTDNVREWETSKKGLAETTHHSTVGTQSYMAGRAAGQTQSTTFYADVDASKLTKQDLMKLDNVTHRFKAFKVKKEEEIREFVEHNIKRPMVLGQSFYELTKTELLREGRNIVVTEKGKNGQITTLYSGPKVRELLNLPKTGKVKINPRNLSYYRIFVESSSNNRRLVRGTEVLVDLTQTKDSNPTWEKKV